MPDKVEPPVVTQAEETRWGVDIGQMLTSAFKKKEPRLSFAEVNIGSSGETTPNQVARRHVSDDDVSLASMQERANSDTTAVQSSFASVHASLNSTSALLPTTYDAYLARYFDDLGFTVEFHGGGEPKEVCVKAFLANVLSMDIPALMRLIKLSKTLGPDAGIDPPVPAIMLVRSFEAFRGMLKEALVNNPPPLIQKQIHDYMMWSTDSPHNLWAYAPGA